MKSLVRLALLATLVPAVGGCVASMAASAIGMAARSAKGAPVGNEGLQPQARTACEDHAARYGPVQIIDVEQRSIDRIVVWGTISTATGRDSFECHFGTRITGFKRRTIATFAEAPQAQYKRDVRALLARVQTDPDYAGVKADANAMTATIYFKGDAARALARYTSDPRISSLSVPVSLRELTEISQRFMTWLTANGFRGTVQGIDARESRVGISVYDPDKVIAAAKKAGLDLTYLQIGDAVPHYTPERD